MSRPFRARVLATVVTLLAAGCQDYNFNPVGHCVIQPGTDRFTLSSISTADVLFVVDDSGSMGAEQLKLAGGFDRFIQNLDDANVARAAGGLLPIDFHIAVTTTSVFWNAPTTATCSSSCPGASGQTVCCQGSSPVKAPKACTTTADCPGGTTCGKNCLRLKGENYCCNQADGSFPVGSLVANVACSPAGIACGTLETHYDAPGCGNPNLDQWPFPHGDFVSSWNASIANPRVLHFDKQLYTGSTTNRQGFTRDELKAAFKGGTFKTFGVLGNVIPGTCGSGQEQGLQAAQLALNKAFAGQQRDTFSLAGAQTWTAATRDAGSAAEWPHSNAKLVVVFVGDEDDCSSPQNPSGGVVMIEATPGSDSCVLDATTSPPLGHKEIDVASFVDSLMNRGRPVGAAFIVSAAQTSCSGLACTPGTCCQPDCPSAGVCGQDFGPNYCGGQSPGTRFFAAANALRAKGADVVQGSICDPNFGDILSDIAEIVKTPQTLSLPTQPAEGGITLLRIASSNGDTRKLCGAPLAPTNPNYTLLSAQDTHADWWFTGDANPREPYVDPAGAPTAVAPSKFVYINPKGSCIANPGETYSADYLGQIPVGGCSSDADCAAKLGGLATAWDCYVPPGLSTGTCTCRANP